jgi:DNA modification methylase
MANRQHPTAKPVELVERAVDNSSKPHSIVLDPFAGSGTTVIACQRRKRRARLIELDPGYTDVICQRWQQYTGKPAVLDSSGGHTFTEIADQRRKIAA